MASTATPPPLGTLRLTDSIAAISGNFGTVGVIHAGARTFMIDTGLAERADDLLAAVAAVAPGKVDTIFTTHWHPDHVGANVRLGQAGARIVGHENCLRRLSSTTHFAAFNRTIEALPAAGRPVETFSGDGTIDTPAGPMQYFHAPHAHTDGDLWTFFPEANIVHCGDLFFNRLYPIVDASTGGSVRGFIAAQARILKQCDARTRVIPGHGPLGNRDDLTRAHDMLTTVTGKLEALKRAGKSVEEAVAAQPTAAFDADWGRGMMTPDIFVQLAYASLLQEKG